jgi:ABC-type transport system involved in multi-copper enzyme maturation permease subunit
MRRWTRKLLAVVRYELFWNIRKKKFLGMFVIAFALTTLSLASGHIRSAFTGEPVESNPDFLIESNLALGGFGFFLFAIVTVMNAISGEFESGTIVPLLAKPVSRNIVFFGKLFAAFLTLLTTYSFLLIYLTIGGVVIYGPQSNIHLVPLSLLGALFSIMIWVSIVLLFGTLSRSSLIAALGALGVWVATNIVGSILAGLAGQGWILTYIPGSGTTASVGEPPVATVSTGTDSIGPNLINYVLHPSWGVTYYRLNIGGTPLLIPLYSEPLSTLILKSIAVAAIYFTIFIAISWFAFKHAQVKE